MTKAKGVLQALRAAVSRVGKVSEATRGKTDAVPLPPPYKRMLAINSDIEWTRWPVQLALLEEFAKRDLETAFSFWLFGSPKVTWRLFEEDGTPSSQAPAAFALGRAGLLDTLHSIGGRRHLGGCRFDREAISKAYGILASEGVRPQVYTNHGSEDDRQNIGGNWSTYQEGDLPGSDLYHLDLTVAAGAQFFWCDPDYVVRTGALDAAFCGEDDLFLTSAGRDGTALLRFRRFLGELKTGPSLDNFAVQLYQAMRHGSGHYTVLYQHLGVVRDGDGRPQAAKVPPLPADVADALDTLARAQADGEVLVTTTGRLLTHAALMAAKPWSVERDDSGVLHAHFDAEMQLDNIRRAVHWDDLMGWAVPIKAGQRVIGHLRNESRALEIFEVAGRPYAGFPWRKIDMGAAIKEARMLSDAVALADG